MTAARILIISNGALYRNPRVYKEATALGTAGHAVTVLTVRNHPASELHDLELMRNAPFQRQTVDTVAGFSTDRIRPFLRRSMQWLSRKGTEYLHWQSAGTLGPAGSLLRAARGIKSDLVIVHNEVPHWVGTRLMADGRRVCADIEDWHSEDLLPEHRVGRPMELMRQVERTLLHQTVHTTTTSHTLADALHVRYGGNRPHVITNSFPLQPIPDFTIPGDPPAFFWFSQTTGPGRGLELFLAAWKQTCKPSRLVLLGEVSARYREDLLKCIPVERRSHVAFHPLVSPAELTTVIANHDIGLALEQSFIPNRDLTITNKILQYLGASLAVVASDTLGQREVLSRDSRAGIIVQLEETERCAHQLDDLLSKPDELVQRRLAARRLAENHYCWELEAPRLVKLVAQALC